MSKRRNSKCFKITVNIIGICEEFGGAYCWRNQYFLQTYQNQRKPVSKLKRSRDFFIFVLCPDLPSVTFLHLKLFLHLSLLQRTLGKPEQTRVLPCGKELEKQPWTEAIFAKKWQNLYLGVLTVCYHSPRSSKAIQIIKRYALLKSILGLNILGGFKRLQINPYQADSENSQEK